MFVPVQTVGSVYFTGCTTCTNRCCEGGKFSLAPLILEDFERVYKNFEIFFGFVDGNLKALMVLNRGSTEVCKYLENGICTIYENRPPACKLYPISPYYDEIYVDSSCDGVSSSGEFLVSPEKINPNFMDKRLDNFSSKLQSTHAWLDTIKHDLDYVDNVMGINLLKYVGPLDDKYIKMHLISMLI